MKLTPHLFCTTPTGPHRIDLPPDTLLTTDPAYRAAIAEALAMGATAVCVEMMRGGVVVYRGVA
jgi:hypothetical protein